MDDGHGNSGYHIQHVAQQEGGTGAGARLGTGARGSVGAAWGLLEGPEH